MHFQVLLQTLVEYAADLLIQAGVTALLEVTKVCDGVHLIWESCVNEEVV